MVSGLPTGWRVTIWAAISLIQGAALAFGLFVLGDGLENGRFAAKAAHLKLNGIDSEAIVFSQQGIEHAGA